MTDDNTHTLDFAFAVGHRDEMDWHCIRAPTADEAMRLYVVDHLDGKGTDGERLPDDELDERADHLDHLRVPEWDAFDRQPTGVEWLAVALSAPCDRCDAQCWLDDDAQIVKGEAICETCFVCAALAGDAA